MTPYSKRKFKLFSYHGRCLTKKKETNPLCEPDMHLSGLAKQMLRR